MKTENPCLFSGKRVILPSAKRLKPLCSKARNAIKRCSTARWIWFILSISREIGANDASFERFGYTREELPRLNVASLINEDQLPSALKAIQEIIDTGSQKDLIEVKLRHRDGSTIYVETKGSIITKEGKPVAIQSIARDITERKKAEAHLQQTLESLKKAVGTTIQVLVSALRRKILTRGSPVPGCASCVCHRCGDGTGPDTH